MWLGLLFKYNIYDTTSVVQLKKGSAAYHCILKSFYVITTFCSTAVQISGSGIWMETSQSSQLLYIKTISLFLGTWGLQALESVECGACTGFSLFLIAACVLAIGLCVLPGAQSGVCSPKQSSFGALWVWITYLHIYCRIVILCNCVCPGCILQRSAGRHGRPFPCPSLPCLSMQRNLWGCERQSLVPIQSQSLWEFLQVRWWT